MIARGSSLRGLSEVTTARSASRLTTSPMSGRFARSRSPPQPKTQITRRRRKPACLGEDVLERLGRVRVVDEDGEGLALVHRLEAARHPGDVLDAAHDRVVLDPEQARGCDRAEDVLDVEAAAQLRADGQRRRRGSS